MRGASPSPFPSRSLTATVHKVLMIVPFILLWMGLPPTARAQVSFGPASEMATGTGPNALAAGHDGAGLHFIAVTDKTSNNLDVVLVNADGTMKAPASYPLVSQSWPTAVVVADVNHDGKDDIMVAVTRWGTEPGSVNVFLGNGDGTFQAPLVSATGLTFSSLTAGDLDGDGNLDLVGATGGVGILWGKGDGTFEAAVQVGTYSGNSSDYATAVAVGDLNGDGRPDIAVANRADTVVVLNTGNRTFALQPALAPYASFVLNPTLVAVGDFNSDGRLDIAVGTSNNGVLIYLGHGDGTFAAPLEYYGANSPSGLAAADLNGDGKLDLVISGYNDSNLCVLRGAGDGSFQNDNCFNSGGSGAIGVIAADLNGDSHPDLVVANLNSNDVGVLLNTPGQPSLTGTTTQLSSSLNPSSYGQTVSFTATVKPVLGSSAAPSGTVSVLDGGQNLATLPLNSAGAATISTPALAPGTHSLTAKYSGDTSFSQSTSSMLAQTVNGITSCAAGSPPSAIICAPAAGATVTSPARFTAAAVSGSPISSISLLVDGVAKYQGSGSQVDANVSLPLGTHTLQAQARDGSGAVINSASQSVTVSGINTICGTITAPGVLMCSPSGSTVNAPVEVKAAGYSPYGVSALWVYADNVAVYKTTSSSLDTTLTLGSGSHTVATQMWDSKGNLYKASDSFMVPVNTPPCNSTVVPSVTICTPQSGWVTGSPVSVLAYANDPVTISAMWVYLDGAVVYKSSGSPAVSASIPVATSGQHTIHVQAWDIKGTTSQGSTTFWVNQLSGSSCASTVDPSVTLCFPQNNGSYLSPVEVQVTSHDSAGISAIWIYVDNVVQYKTTASFLDTKIALPAGQHVVRFQAWDRLGRLFKGSANITVLP